MPPESTEQQHGLAGYVGISLLEQQLKIPDIAGIIFTVLGEKWRFMLGGTSTSNKDIFGKWRELFLKGKLCIMNDIGSTAAYLFGMMFDENPSVWRVAYGNWYGEWERGEPTCDVVLCSIHSRKLHEWRQKLIDEEVSEFKLADGDRTFSIQLVGGEEWPIDNVVDCQWPYWSGVFGWTHPFSPEWSSANPNCVSMHSMCGSLKVEILCRFCHIHAGLWNCMIRFRDSAHDGRPGEQIVDLMATQFARSTKPFSNNSVHTALEGMITFKASLNLFPRASEQLVISTVQRTRNLLALRHLWAQYLGISPSIPLSSLPPWRRDQPTLLLEAGILPDQVSQLQKFDGSQIWLACERVVFTVLSEKFRFMLAGTCQTSLKAFKGWRPAFVEATMDTINSAAMKAFECLWTTGGLGTQDFDITRIAFGRLNLDQDENYVCDVVLDDISEVVMLDGLAEHLKGQREGYVWTEEGFDVWTGVHHDRIGDICSAVYHPQTVVGEPPVVENMAHIVLCAIAHGSNCHRDISVKLYLHEIVPSKPGSGGQWRCVIRFLQNSKEEKPSGPFGNSSPVDLLGTIFARGEWPGLPLCAFSEQTKARKLINKESPLGVLY